MTRPPARDARSRPLSRAGWRCLVVTAGLLCSTAALAAPARFDDILEAQRQHGYASPLLAARELAAARDRPGESAPVADRLRFHAALAELATTAGRLDLAAPSMAELARLGRRRDCPACTFLWHIRQAQDATARGHVDDARKFLALARRDLPRPTESQQLDLLDVQSTLQDYANEPAPALEAALRAAELAARLDQPARQVDLLGTAMHANLTRGDTERALELSTEVYALAKRIGYTFEMAVTRTNQSYVYGERKDYPRFKAALDDALRLTESVPGLEDLVLTTLVNLSAYHIHVGEYPESIAVTHRAEKLAVARHDELSRAFLISNRGSAMARMGQVDAGLALMQQASEMADRAGDKRATIDLLAEKVNVYELVGRPVDALKTLRRVVELDRSLTARERDAALLELQTRFSAERKTREIGRLSAENARRRAEVEARTWQQRLWAAVAVALAFGTALLWTGLRHVRRRNRALEVDNATLAEQSSHDALTGVFNRRHCERLMAEQAQAVRRRSRDRDYRTCVGLVLLDIDFFKSINDTHGHAGGDAVLVAVARRLQALVRDRDAVVRWGGEEFLLMLPGTPAEGLDVVARRVLDAIGRTPVDVGGTAVAVTASAGCVAWPLGAGQTWQDALHVADLALYRSKGGGRNRATCVSAGSRAPTARAREDLAAAEANGEVVLSVVCGPAQGLSDAA